MRILLGISGGVDSAYAAYKLKAEGHTVVGATLVMHDYTDVAAARRVCKAVGIELIEIDCREDFDRHIKEYFIKEYSHGRTPNPCIVCNREVKFKYLYDYAMAHGFDRIATGHYARIITRFDGGERRFAFTLADDIRKDQTYMLYRLSQKIMEVLLLPMSDEIKTDVKEHADALGLVDAGQRESQEICFIPDNDYAAFIEERVGRCPEGSFIDEDGNVLGTHKGIIHYTVGQRKGLGISLGYRAFVSSIDPVSGNIVLKREGDYTSVVNVSDMVFSGMRRPEKGHERQVKVKLRYLATPASARAVFNADGGATLYLDTPCKAVTPGQSAVLYEDGCVLAGGFIDG